MDRIVEALFKFVTALLELLFAPFRILAHMCGPSRSEADLVDSVAAEVREAEARIERAGMEPEMEPLAIMARNFIHGGVADICRLPKRQQLWLYAARAQGVDVSNVSDRDLEFHVRGRASEHGLPAIVDEVRLARVREAYREAQADRAWDTGAPAFGF